LTSAPRATTSRATCQQAYPIASASGVPIDPSGALMSAPPSISAAATSTSSLLAAQCGGVSPGSPDRPVVRAFGSAPGFQMRPDQCLAAPPVDRGIG
jgi:hypothetical protein